MIRFAACLFLILMFSAAIAAAPQPPEFREAYRKYTELMEQGKYGEAIPYAQKALDIALKSPAFDDDTRGKLAFNLGYANFRDSRLSDAVAAFGISLENLEKAPKPDKGLIADALVYRGICHRSLYGDRKAEQDLLRAVEILSGTQPAERIVRAEALENLAWVMVRRRYTRRASEYATEAHEIYARLLGARHPRTLRIQLLIAAIHYLNGKRGQAKNILAGAVLEAEKLGIEPDGSAELSKTKKFTMWELGQFHTEVAQLYDIMGQKNDAEYHRKLAGDLGKGIRPAALNVKPLVRVPPRYPGIAASKGQNGWVLLEYTVRKDGSTADIRIVDAAPEGEFDDAARDAVAKWKYEPPIINGQSSDVTGVRTLILFKIENPDVASKRDRRSIFNR